MKITIGPVEPVNTTHIRLLVKVAYNGSIPLVDFKIELLGKQIFFGDLVRGNYTQTITLPLREASKLENASIGYEFKIGGIYHIKLSIER